jgi:hypothetical protein
MKYVRVYINLTIYVQIILSHSLVVIHLTAVVRGESVVWRIDVTESNLKPLAQLPLTVPSIDIQLKTWRSEFHVPGNAASSKRSCIPWLHPRRWLCGDVVVMWLYGQLLIISVTAMSCLRRLSYVPSLFLETSKSLACSRDHTVTPYCCKVHFNIIFWPIPRSSESSPFRGGSYSVSYNIPLLKSLSSKVHI